MAKEPKILNVRTTAGFSGECFTKSYILEPNQVEFSFDVEDGVPYLYETSIIDGDAFDVEIVFFNSGKTRSETYKLVPMPEDN